MASLETLFRNCVHIFNIDVSPEDFAAREEMREQAGWSGGEKKSKGKVRHT